MARLSVKERLPLFGSLSGLLSILGSSVSFCSLICSGFASFVGIAGVVLGSLPITFLSIYSLYFWWVAFLLFIVSAYFYYKHKILARELLLLNAAAIIIKTPFYLDWRIEQFLYLFGITLIFVALFLFLSNRGKGINKTAKKQVKNN